MSNDQSQPPPPAEAATDEKPLAPEPAEPAAWINEQWPGGNQLEAKAQHDQMRLVLRLLLAGDKVTEADVRDAIKLAEQTQQ